MPAGLHRQTDRPRNNRGGFEIYNYVSQRRRCSRASLQPLDAYIIFWTLHMDNTDCYKDFCEMAQKAMAKGNGLQFRRYGQNLRYNSAGVYSFGVQIADLDLTNKTIKQREFLSPTSIKHYNHAKYMLELRYEIYEKEQMA